MRYFIFLLIVFMPTVANASYFIVNIDNKIVATTEYKPDAADLDKRNEIAVSGDDSIKIEEAEYRDGKIVKHTETSAELDKKIEEQNLAEDLAAINAKAKKMAYEELKKEGKTFKKLKDSDFE